MRGSSSSENSWEEDKKEFESKMDDTWIKLRENWKAHLKEGEEIILSNWGHFDCTDPNDNTKNFLLGFLNMTKWKVILFVDGRFTLLESTSNWPDWAKVI